MIRSLASRAYVFEELPTSTCVDRRLRTGSLGIAFPSMGPPAGGVGQYPRGAVGTRLRGLLHTLHTSPRHDA